jgi:hypothetical protein
MDAGQFTIVPSYCKFLSDIGDHRRDDYDGWNGSGCESDAIANGELPLGIGAIDLELPLRCRFAVKRDQGELQRA